jgi:superfamily II DNA or RNA helicase
MSKIDIQFKKYKISKKKETMSQICKPKNFQLQPQQKFLTDFFKSNLSKDGVLIYHKIGAGKTCTAISVAESYKKIKKILVILPASLVGNFRDELRSQCPGDAYISKIDREELNILKPKSSKYKKIIDESDKKINKFYTIYSYHKFIQLCEDKKIKLKNTLLVIDEVQNMVSESGTFYTNLKNVIDKSDSKTKIVLLSATPMFDKPVEIALTFNLLKPKKELPIGTEFNNMFLKPYKRKNEILYEFINQDKFQKIIKGYISYYRGAQPKAFPKDNFNVVRCNMENFQYKSYLTSLSADGMRETGSFNNVDILELPMNFLIGPRFISNISFPNKGIGPNGYASLKGNSLKSKNIKNYSKKFYKIYNNVKKSTGPIFIYSNFKDYGGIKSLVKFLEYNGFKNYKTYGEGKLRFAIWSGDESNKIKNEIKAVFNNKYNHNGSKIKIILGTPAIKEGVSLLRVEQVHILEPYWNLSRMKQIIGRAIRFCSHKDLPGKRRFVDIFLYLATYSGIKTADEIIWSMAKRKDVLVQQFEKVMKESAIDCRLFYNRNVYPGEKPLKCINI